jgi:hypothetical protein
MTRKLLAAFGAIALAAAYAVPASACPAHTTENMSTPVKTAQNGTSTQTSTTQSSQD